MSVRSEILEGMAEILWASAWASHAEEHGCVNLSGQRIEHIMPTIPARARTIVKGWASKIESANGVSLDNLFARAVAADKAKGKGQPGPEEFGNALAFEGMGSGVSWDDDHADFPRKIPSLGNAGGDELDLMDIAAKGCPDKKSNPPCKGCGSYNREGRAKCANCGEALK
jgi:hypothetical protein